MLIQEEKQREIRSARHFLAESAYLAVEAHKQQQHYKGKMDKGEVSFDNNHSRFERSDGKKSNLFYNYCKRSGQSIEKCYRLHGFLPNSKYKGGRRTTAVPQINDHESDCQGSSS